MEKKNLTDTEKLEIEHYYKYRDYLIWEKHKMEYKFWQHLIYLSAWVFAFSVAIESIHPTTECKSLLFISWWLALSNMILILIYFWASSQNYEKQIYSWDKNRKFDDNNAYFKIQKFIVFLTIIFILFALLLLFIFYIINY